MSKKNFQDRVSLLVWPWCIITLIVLIDVGRSSLKVGVALPRLWSMDYPGVETEHQ